MPWRARALLLALASLTVLSSSACSKDADESKAPKVRTLGARAVPVPPPPATAPPREDDTTEAPPPAEHVVIGPSDAGPLYYTVKLHPDASTPAVDPDLAVIASARTAGAACFTGITDGSRSRSATIQVTVLPSGSVNRSEVSSGSTREAWVLSCLEGVGNGLHFADKPAADIRTYFIGVTVTLDH
jgi:hypothetical protein